MTHFAQAEPASLSHAATLETIFAPASGQGRSAVAIVRVSGPKAGFLLGALAGYCPEPRRATLAILHDPENGEALDEALVLWFPGPKSFTGEDCAEFHVHGGRAVMAGLLAALGRFEQVRPAEPGEFTRRALLNGKLDLAEVEGLADMIEAETEWQRRQALRQMRGALSRQAEMWRQALLEALSLAEAEIDFSDEADVPPETSRRVAALIEPVLADLRAELGQARAGERIREGLSIVIMGPPNAGKSTLLNALARREVAIVSEIAGTTRDLIEVHLDLKGCAVVLTDTAGLRDNADKIEQIGIARAYERGREADLVLWLSEAEAPVAPPENLGMEVWPVFTKADRVEPLENREGLAISATSGLHLGRLVEAIADFAGKLAPSGHAGLITRARHRQAFERAAAALDRCIREASPVELLAEDLRLAAQALLSLTGRIETEEILGEIFARFCIGK
ncbi:tRNA uridine-5-carboxymethylaminomethyl(34) synthesis GTPase MnmE [Beijerinckia indica]|uniref:tRNA modification GTPase MnmE n=1 Tax=Beijerinckia indica subsp. indica (strain ATCC 9039 / DSM 1715 / NCIMB 8712) TaxID=395963 RepID=MNME_BEII9|nr:tRNA uridine-5-carboxymethylaminomethyl(34) synthesis GTPase MnmE [Beijerinckia indica]B2IJQ3.1 RecName: Full=tRNA modification GTPase MnmE [Beijerinckia indica subsp. indica ATCC 9039]ACB94925.1 tRNA modification GTPase TrmE [Beijerinckia indica subsp. indica ATCC 9039]